MGASGPIIPYAGNFGGFMPYRLGGAGSAGGLSFSSRTAPVMGSARTSVSRSPLLGRLSSMPTGMGRGFGSRVQIRRSLGSSGSMSLGGGMREPDAGPGSTSVMPPSFAYPFYQPPSLVGPSSPGAGMSM
jgi:hypothetical protein